MSAPGGPSETGLSGAWTAAMAHHHGAYGFYLHQLGHVFFGVSLAVFLFYIFGKRLTGERAWLYIAIAALALIIWDIFSFFQLLYNLSSLVLAASAFFLYLGIRRHLKSLELEDRD